MGDLVILTLRPAAAPLATLPAFEVTAYPAAVCTICGGVEAWWMPGDARAWAVALDTIQHPRARAMAQALRLAADTAEQLEAERD